MASGAFKLVIGRPCVLTNKVCLRGLPLKVTYDSLLQR